MVVPRLCIWLTPEPFLHSFAFLFESNQIPSHTLCITMMLPTKRKGCYGRGLAASKLATCNDPYISCEVHYFPFLFFTTLLLPRYALSVMLSDVACRCQLLYMLHAGIVVIAIERGLNNMNNKPFSHFIALHGMIFKKLHHCKQSGVRTSFSMFSDHNDGNSNVTIGNDKIFLL